MFKLHTSDFSFRSVICNLFLPGNTARKIFENSKIVSEILTIPPTGRRADQQGCNITEEYVERLNTIRLAVSSRGNRLCPVKFHEYTQGTKSLYYKLKLDYFPISSAVHKV